MHTPDSQQTNGQQTRAKQAAQKRGEWAERLAAFALMLKGYRPLMRRFKTRVGEIDLVMRRGNLIIFVEVKARASHEAALESITTTAKNRIQKAANLWLSHQKSAANLSWRFDVVTVVPWRWPRHYEQAW